MRAMLALLCGAGVTWGATTAFEPMDGGVRFLARTGGYRATISADGAAIRVRGGEVQVHFAHGRRARLDGVDRLPGTVSYLIGNDPRHWRRGIPTYAQVRGRGIYPGVDILFHGGEEGLEYDFLVAPGADISRIRLQFTGTLRIDEAGDLVAGELRQRKPLIYQERDGRREIVGGHYLVTGAREAAFVVPQYDRRRPLVIDPELVFASQVGGSNSQQVSGIATDGEGNTYTASAPVISTAPHQVLVTKLDPTGQKVLYSTYIGGSTYEQSGGIAVDQLGAAYVTGATQSTDFPVTRGALQAGGQQGGTFIFKLNASGDSLVYSALVTDTGTQPAGIAVDAQGSAYITGTTVGNLPVTSGAYWSIAPVQPQPGFFGPPLFGGDAFALKLDAQGASLSYCTYANKPGIGGGFVSGLANAIAVDSSGDAFITGPDYVLKFNGAGSGLVYSVPADPWGVNYLGKAIVVDTHGNAYITGSTDFGHAFAAKFDASGTPYFNTGNRTLGGGSGDAGQGIAVDSMGNIYVAGNTSSIDFPLRSPVQEAFNTETGFLAELDGSGKLLFSTYVGDADAFQMIGLALDASGKPVFGGNTSTAAYVAKYDTAGIAALQLDSLWNLANQLAVPVSPGELVKINGAGFGKDVQLYFDAAPATMIPGASTPTAIVPYALDGKTYTVAHVESGGQSSNEVDIPVVPAAPGIFTLDGSGTGQALAFNQDGTANSSAHPAPVGSVVTFFVTGAGQTVPPGVDGVLHRSAPAPTVLPFSVYIGYVYVPGFQFSVGPAPGFTADVLKVAATVPTVLRGSSEGFPLTTALVQVQENGVSTQNPVTIWIGE